MFEITKIKLFFRPNYILIPEKRDFTAARAFCKMLSNDLLLPRTAQENQEIYNFVSQFHSVCKPHNHAFSFMFLGATDITVNGKWKDLSVCYFSYSIY